MSACATVLALVCLTNAGHGNRVRVTDQQISQDMTVGHRALTEDEQLRPSSRRLSAPKVLTTLLLALRPTAGWQFPLGSHIQASSDQHCTQLRSCTSMKDNAGDDMPDRLAGKLHCQPCRRDFLSGTAAAAVSSITTPAFANSKKSRDDPSYEVRKNFPEWSSTLTDYQFFILRNGGTEPPNTSPLVKEKRQGVFRCAGCDNKLFDSSQKFDSGTGWPSYAKAINEQAVEVEEVNPFIWFLTGAECRCARCGGHLGDVFLDGWLWVGSPAFFTFKRFCIDGTSLAFEPDGAAAGTRVSGESILQKLNSPADVELPSWLQPPKPRQV